MRKTQFMASQNFVSSREDGLFNRYYSKYKHLDKQCLSSLVASGNGIIFRRPTFAHFSIIFFFSKNNGFQFIDKNKIDSEKLDNLFNFIQLVSGRARIQNQICHDCSSIMAK